MYVFGVKQSNETTDNNFTLPEMENPIWRPLNWILISQLVVKIEMRVQRTANVTFRPGDYSVYIIT